MIEWINKILIPYAKMRKNDGVLTVFLMDAASFHTGNSVTTLLKDNE
jgi:hypothetical protein